MSQFYFDTEKNRYKSFELPGAKPHYTPDRPGQVEHIFLDINLDVTKQSYHGTCTISLKPIRDCLYSLTLDAVNLNIELVEVDAQAHWMPWSFRLVTPNRGLEGIRCVNLLSELAMAVLVGIVSTVKRLHEAPNSSYCQFRMQGEAMIFFLGPAPQLRRVIV